MFPGKKALVAFKNVMKRMQANFRHDVKRFGFLGNLNRPCPHHLSILPFKLHGQCIMQLLDHGHGNRDT